MTVLTYTTVDKMERMNLTCHLRFLRHLETVTGFDSVDQEAQYEYDNDQERKSKHG